MATKAGLDYTAVIQAAAEPANADGLHEVTLANLANRLGIRTPTLYHYFTGWRGCGANWRCCTGFAQYGSRFCYP
jgi:hypothetical protein